MGFWVQMKGLVCALQLSGVELTWHTFQALLAVLVGGGLMGDAWAVVKLMRDNNLLLNLAHWNALLTVTTRRTLGLWFSRVFKGFF